LQQQEQKKQQDGTFCFSLLFLCNLMKIFNINIKFGQNVNGVPRLGQLLYSFRTQTHHPSPTPTMPGSILWPVWSRSEFWEYSANLQDKKWKKNYNFIIYVKSK